MDMAFFTVVGSLLIWHLLPRIVSDKSYWDFYCYTGYNLGDFVFVSLIASVYLVRFILWSLKQLKGKQIKGLGNNPVSVNLYNLA